MMRTRPKTGKMPNTPKTKIPKAKTATTKTPKATRVSTSIESHWSLRMSLRRKADHKKGGKA